MNGPSNWPLRGQGWVDAPWVPSAWSLRTHSPGSPSGRNCVRRLSNSPGLSSRGFPCTCSPSPLSGQRTRRRTEAGRVDRLTQRNAAQGALGFPWVAFLSLPYPNPTGRASRAPRDEPDAGQSGPPLMAPARSPRLASPETPPNDGCRLTGWRSLYYGPRFTLVAVVGCKGKGSACSFHYRGNPPRHSPILHAARHERM